MSERDIKEVMSKALEISQKQIFNVKIHHPNEPMYTSNKMTYFELGIFLTQKNELINHIEIFMD